MTHTAPTRSPDGTPAGTPARIVVLASGGGSNLQSLIDHFAGAASAVGQIVWVGSDREEAGALQRAARAGIASGLVEAPGDANAMCAQLDAIGTDVLVLAGYLKLVPAGVVRAFHGRLLNIHPALLPAFGGAGMWGPRIHQAVIAHGVTVTGVTVHFVDEEFDRGPILAQWPVPVRGDDTPESLAARVLQVEHLLYPPCVEAVAARRVGLDAEGRVRGAVGVDSTLPPSTRFALSAAAAATFAAELGAMFPR